MQCLKCSHTGLTRRRVGFFPEIKGVTVDVVSEAMVCEKCHTPVMDPNMMNALRQGAADKYHMEQGFESR